MFYLQALSGGVPLDPQWAPSPACGAGCFEAALPSVAAIPGLRRDGVREIRARWPNFDEELDSVDESGVYHVCGNFDIILGPFSAHFQLHPTPHALWAVFYLVPRLTSC